MQVKSIAELFQGEDSAILLTFIKLPFVIKTFVLPIFEWLFYTGFTVYHKYQMNKGTKKFEPQHELSNNVVHTTSKASDQPAHTRSLIRAFASRLNIL